MSNDIIWNGKGDELQWYKDRAARLADLLIKANRDQEETERSLNKVIVAHSKGEPITIDTTQLDIKVSNLEAELTNAQRVVKGLSKECHDVEQNLGIALGYVRYTEVPAQYPDAVEADGVCVDKHTPSSISMEAAQKITEQRAYIQQADAKNAELLSEAWSNQNIHRDLLAARNAQISIYDMENPPRVMQGAPTNPNQDVLTALDVAYFLRRIEELQRSETELTIELDDMRQQRNGAIGENTAVRETTSVTLSNLRTEKRELQSRVLRAERIAERALQLMLNTEHNPVGSLEYSRARMLRDALGSVTYGPQRFRDRTNINEYMQQNADTVFRAPPPQTVNQWAFRQVNQRDPVIPAGSPNELRGLRPQMVMMDDAVTRDDMLDATAMTMTARASAPTHPMPEPAPNEWRDSPYRTLPSIAPPEGETR